MTAPEQMRAEYPSSQEEAVNASGWRFHSGGAWAADCDLIYYRLRHAPERVLGPTPPALLTWRWRAGDDRHCDIIAWLPVLAECQRTRPAPAELVEAQWQPTSEAINSLPEPLRRFIHDLAAKCDPAGDVKVIWSQREQIAGLVARVKELENGRA